MAALRESQKINDSLLNRNIALQAGNLLNEVYCGNAKTALQTQETKRKKITGTLPGGLARVLTADNFFEARENFEKEQRNKVKAKETRKDSRAAWKEAKEEWQQNENARIATRDREHAIYEELKTTWEAENVCGHGRRRGGRGRGAATLEQLPKPTKPVIPKCIPPPLLKDFLAGNNEELGQREGGSTSDNDDSASGTGDDADNGNDD